MNTLAVQNPHHKCDLGNKNGSSVTDKKITTSQANLLIELIKEESNPIADQFSLLIFAASLTLTP